MPGNILSSARNNFNTISNRGFADSTRLESLNSFLSLWNQSFPNDPIDEFTSEQFTVNEGSLREAASKLVKQIDMVDKGDLSQENFFSSADDVFREVMDQVDLRQDAGKFDVPKDTRIAPIVDTRSEGEFEQFEFLEAEETGKTIGEISLGREKARFARASNLALEAFGAGTTIEQNNLALGILRQMRDKSISNAEKEQFDRSIRGIEAVSKIQARRAPEPSLGRIRAEAEARRAPEPSLGRIRAEAEARRAPKEPPTSLERRKVAVQEKALEVRLKELEQRGSASQQKTQRNFNSAFGGIIRTYSNLLELLPEETAKKITRNALGSLMDTEGVDVEAIKNAFKKEPDKPEETGGIFDFVKDFLGLGGDTSTGQITREAAQAAIDQARQELPNGMPAEINARAREIAGQ